MNSDTPKYYMPYDSDTEEDTDEESDGASYESNDFEDSRIRREEDPRYAIIAAAGPNFNTSAEQLKYMEHAPGSSYNNSTNITNLSNFVYLNPPKTTKTSLLSIKSSNRDTTVWKSPFYFQLKTPKVYKNITKFQLVQISFPNNTQNFINSPSFTEQLAQILIQKGVPENCLSTCVTITGCTPSAGSVGIVEQGRLNALGQPMLTPISIPSGFYDNHELANHLTQSANNTPPFSIISFDNFKKEFMIHRDISILFNEPGENFQSNVAKHSRPIHSKHEMIETYYSIPHIDKFPVITDKIAFNAYYYPVLKELLAAAISEPFLKLGSYNFSQIKTFVLGQFLGLNSDIYYNICLDNQGTLDEFRRIFTFELRHINKYIFTYNSNQNQFCCIHDSLHTSLKNEINNKYDDYLNHALKVKGFNQKSYQSLKTGYSNNNAIFKEMEQYLSTQLANTFFITNYQYMGGMLHSGLDAVTDLHADLSFTTIFNQTQTFGDQLYGNFHGSEFTFSNFLDYHSTLSSYYNITQSTQNVLSSIHGYTHSKHHEYISTKYTGILPHHIIYNSTYTDCKGVPAAFVANPYLHSPGQGITNKYLAYESLSVVPPSILSGFDISSDGCESVCCEALESILKGYYSCLPTNSVVATVPYRLGLVNVGQVNFNLISTFFQFSSTSNFNIFLQMNDFQSFNNIDISMKENYAVSNETTGQVSLMAAKILLQGIATGETSETAIQNPILFETPLGKLDKLEFKMYVDDESLTPLWQYLPFELGINEWDATFQIDEEVGYADRNAGFSGNIPTIPIPQNPSGFQYMALTSTVNTLNK